MGSNMWGCKMWNKIELLQIIARIYMAARQSYAGSEGAAAACEQILAICREVYPPGNDDGDMTPE